MAAVDFRALFAAALAGLTLSGCNYVHFGRQPPSNAQLAQENSDMRTERTILQQELAIAHKEGEALRTALEARAGSGARESEVATQLESATRELAALRVRYAALRDEQARSPAAPGTTDSTGAGGVTLQSRLTATEDHLAATLRDYIQLRDENVQLRQNLERARGETAALAIQVRDLGTQNRDTQTALTQLNAELLAQKESRTRAEQAAEALRAQLHTVVAQSRTPDQAPSLDGSREATASSASTIEATGLRAPNVPVAGPAPTATLGTNPERVRSAAAPGPAAQSTAQPAALRIHQVVAGDTLKNIAAKYYGNPDRWPLIYDANLALLRDGRPLAVGMELTIPSAPEPGP
jgi:nucleoid-associated protein YgaU